MSSLRLALKQSLQETGHLFKDKKKKSSSSKSKESNKHSSSNKPSRKSSSSKQRRPRQPGDPPRKRGRPRKHPLPEEHQQQQQSSPTKASSSSQHAVNDGREGGDSTNRRGDSNHHHHHSGSEEEDSESENEFSYCSEEEEDDSEGDEDEEEDEEGEEHDDEQDHANQSHHDEEDEEEEESGHPEEDGVPPVMAAAASTANATSPASPKAEPKEDTTTESDEERRRKKKEFKKHLQQAAHKIQAQWKKKAGISSSQGSDDDDEHERKDRSYDDVGTTTPKQYPQRSTSPMRHRDHSSNSNASTPTSGDKQQTSKKKKDSGSSKLQTVPPPEPEVLEWNRSLSEKKSRKHVSAGLRVKVRFAAKVKRDGKVVKKKIWYGGRVSAVSKEGSKIRIKYDDGTSEISKFPDKDVVVDDTFNGKHLVTAVKFIPPVMAAAEDDDVEEDAEEGEIQTQAVVVNRGAGADDTTKKNVPEVVAETSKKQPSDDTQAKPAAPEKSAPLVNAESDATPAPAKEELEDKTTDVADTTNNSIEDNPPAAPKEDIAPIAEPKVDASPEVEEPKPSTEPVVASMETEADDSAMAVPEMPAKPEKEPCVPAEAITPAEVLEAGEVVTTPKPKSTASMIASARTASEEGRLPRDLGSPEEGEISPGISLLSRARDTSEPMETDEKPPTQNGGEEAAGEIDNAKATADGDAEPKVKDSVDLPPTVAEEAVDSKPTEAPIEDVAGAPNAAPNDTMFQDLKPPAADAAETEATSAQEKPTEQAREQSSPSTPKPLKIHIVNTKPDAEVGNVVAVQSPKDMESDSEEELFADTPVTERKVKSIQLKRKNKRKREVTEGPADEQPSKKKIHIKRSKASMETNDLGAVSDAEEDTKNPGSPSDVEEETTEKLADVQGALEARSALSEPLLRTNGEEVKKSNTTISVSLRKPEADEVEHILVPKLKKKKDRANIAVKGRKSPVPRSSSPTPQLESAPTMDSQVSEERASGSPGVDDAAALSPKRGKAIASVRGRPGGEADEAAPEAPMLDELSAEVRPLSRSKGSADSLPGMRSGRRAAQQAKEKMTPKQQEDKTLELGKKKKKRKRNEGEEDGEQSADESVDDRQWVQCDDCGKWRILPSSVKISSLPKNWYCRLNTYDPKRNACSAPEQSAKQAAKEWRKARKRLKQQRLAEQQAEEAAQKILEEAPIEVKKEPLVSTSPKPPKGTKKERIDAKRASPVVAEESQASNSGSDVPKERKGKKGKQLPPLPPPQEEVEPAPPTPPPPESDAPKKPGRKRGRPARNQTPQKENEDHDNVEWVQCEKCEKWRKLPPHISADELPDTWYCSMNTWNPDAASCTAAEDKADATHHEVGNYAGLFGGGAGKYSYRSMIFGTGKKHNRPMSERSRAAESLFMRPIDEVENPYPTVMYSKSSCFLPRTSNFTKANAIEEDKPPSIFDVLSNSELWAELHTVGHPMQVTSSSSDSGQAYPKFLSFENLPEDIKEAMREVVLRSLGEGTLTGEELIREVQHYPWESVSPDLAAIRGYFNVDIIINSLLALVRDGVVEMTSMRNFKVPIGQWVPKYRKVRSLRAMKIEESIKSSRCMKISKPWKNSDWISGGSAFS